MFVYKIKRKSDGLFSKGGMDPSFGERGKVWTSRAAMSLHLNQFKYPESIYEGCEIIEYNVIEKCIMTTHQYLKDKENRNK